MATEPPPDRPRRSRVAKVDISGHTDRQVAIRAAVVALGEQAYGPRWQSALAVALTGRAGRTISAAQVSHWLSGKRAVPEGLLPPLTQLAAAAADDLEARAGAIRAAWIHAD